MSHKSVPLSRNPVPVHPVPWATVRSFKLIPATCPCTWAMEFKGRRVSGWALSLARPGCLHHGRQAKAAA